MNENKTDYGPAGWGGLIGGLLIGWFAWRWLDPRYPIILAAVWTLLAVSLGAIGVRGVLKMLGWTGRSFAKGFRRSWDS